MAQIGELLEIMQVELDDAHRRRDDGATIVRVTAEREVPGVIFAQQPVMREAALASGQYQGAREE